jgi:MFS transporter, NNP family, nitrate/nitrite transporter
MVGESRVKGRTAHVVACLAELAVTDELIVVYGSDQPGRNPVVAALRERLPRFKVVPLYVAPPNGPYRCDAALVDGLLDDGSLPIILAPAVTAPTVAAELYHHLRADRMLEVSLV